MDDNVITKERINNFLGEMEVQEREIASALLQSIGLGDLISKKKEKKQVVKIKSDHPLKLNDYNLIIEVECRTCGHVDNKYCIMKWNDENIGLIAFTVNGVESFIPTLETKTTRKYVNKCSYCFDELILKSKQELIDMIFKFVNEREVF